MDTYQKYNHTISEESLLRVLRDAAAHGYKPTVIINGELYDVKLDAESIPSVASADLPF